MITSLTPKARRRESVISSSVRPPTSTRALGRLSVSGRRRVPRPAARIMALIGALSLHRPPLAQFLQLEMADGDFHAVPVAQAFGQLLGEEDGAVLAAGATERDHQILEAALLIVADAGVHQREDAGQKLVHAFLLNEIVDHRSVLAGESLEALFAAGIGEAASVEDESAAVAALVFWQAVVKGKTENPHDEIVRVGGETLQFLRGQHAFKSVH